MSEFSFGDAPHPGSTTSKEEMQGGIEMAKTPTSQTPVTTPGPSAGETLDRFDRDILALLQQDASLSAAEIGVRVGLSQSPCWRRINRLEEAGLITRRVALLDRHRLGLDVLVFAMIKLNAHGRRSLPEFADAIRRYPEVQECFTLLGDMDFLVRIVTRDIQSYERFFFDTLSQLPGVQEVHSNIAMSEMKSTTALPL
jgi:Lrp/AsnC family transcriptional regulator